MTWNNKFRYTPCFFRNHYHSGTNLLHFSIGLDKCFFKSVLLMNFFSQCWHSKKNCPLWTDPMCFTISLFPEKLFLQGGHTWISWNSSQCSCNFWLLINLCQGLLYIWMLLLAKALKRPNFWRFYDFYGQLYGKMVEFF